jgi:hypothetical protein
VAPSASDDTCGTCCDTANAGGINAYNVAFQGACACKDTSTCYADCGTAGAAPDFCADPTKQASDACITCLNGVMQADACVTDFVTACKADATCVAFATCVGGCAG